MARGTGATQMVSRALPSRPARAWRCLDPMNVPVPFRRRGMTDQGMMEGAVRSTIPELAALTLAADKVLVF